MTIAEPLAVTDETVVPRRATYDALMAPLEDAHDGRVEKSPVEKSPGLVSPPRPRSPRKT
jgi:hypothetical protein